MAGRAGPDPRAGRRGQGSEGAKFRDYFDHVNLAKIPSHRLLALFRGRNEGNSCDLDLDPGRRCRCGGEPRKSRSIDAGRTRAERRVACHSASRTRAALPTLAARHLPPCWRAKLHMHLTLDLFGQARERAEAEAIRVFGDNLKDLLLAAPAGPKAMLGLDPGLRTGVQGRGRRPHRQGARHRRDLPARAAHDWDGRSRTRWRLCAQHGVQLISIGNGTASRETDKLAADLKKRHPELKPRKARGQRSRRLGVFGLGTAGEGVPRARRVAARRGVDRAPPAGSAGRTGQDRPEGDRRRPVPARRQPGAAGEVARRTCRGLRERTSAST
jgi:transcriptional accessory protein Tex/SPT6